MMIRRISVLLICGLILTACAGDKDGLANKAPAEDIYADAKKNLGESDYDEAVELFEDVERTYPYSPLATKAKLMIGYTYYKQQAYADAVRALDRFIKLHPGNKDVSYAYYLKALCYYDQITDIGRDQGTTGRARGALKELIARFPESDYARDARVKLDLVNDHLAGKEMEVGRFYLGSNNIIGAINRFKTVLKNYQTTTHTEEALHRLVESYVMLGVVPEAQKYAAVLGNNFPGGEWYGRSFDLMQEYGFNIPESERISSKANDGKPRNFIWEKF